LHIFETLDTEDNKILKLLESAKDHDKIIDLFAMRVTLYKKCAEQTDNPLERGIIEAKKMVIMGEMGLMVSQYEMQKQIDELKSRFDAFAKTSRSEKTS